MKKSTVSIIKYEKPLDSVRKAVELSDSLKNLSSGAKVFVKPNIVFWNKNVTFPKWGLITTSRVVEDMVILLKEKGIKDITIGEGMVIKTDDRETAEHAFETLGYNTLKKRYGVKILNVFERPFKKVELEEGIELSFNIDYLESDFLVNIPVLKTHGQTVVSLGSKNLKGLLDIESRKKCHNPAPDRDLHYMISLVQKTLPPSMTIIDGIYTNERGPMFGDVKRSNILIASGDPISADITGTRVLGYEAEKVPYLFLIAEKAGRNKDMSDIEITGEKLEDVITPHAYAVPYSKDGRLSMDLYGMGVRGLTCRNPGLTICTYCVGLLGLMTTAIGLAWRGEAWDKVEILSGKTMKPSPGMNKTILLGKCMCQLNKDNPLIKEVYAVKGCPPDPEEVVKILHTVGINVNPAMLENPEILLRGIMELYRNRPEFDENFFRV